MSSNTPKNSYESLPVASKLIFLAGIFDGEGSFGIWSKGIGALCNNNLPNYWNENSYMIRSTEFFWENLRYFKGKVWIRLGNNPGNCDLINFSKLLDYLVYPITLVTTDGNISSPSSLPKRVYTKILNSDKIHAWYTQNWDGYQHKKLHPFPIGLDFHTFNNLQLDNMSSDPGIKSFDKLQKIYQVYHKSKPLEQRNPKIFCDLTNQFISYQKITDSDLSTNINNNPNVECLENKVTQEVLWEKYSSYKFAISPTANGLDNHLTWELILLGCIVITKTSNLDKLYQDLPVIIIDDWDRLTDMTYLNSRLPSPDVLQNQNIINKLSISNWYHKISSPPNDNRKSNNIYPRVSGLTITCPEYYDKVVFDTCYISKTEFIINVYKLETLNDDNLTIKVEYRNGVTINYYLRDFTSSVKTLFIKHNQIVDYLLLDTPNDTQKQKQIDQIPKVIHQSFIHHYLPDTCNNYINCLKGINPEYEYNLYDTQTSRNFIRDNFDENILRAFNYLRPDEFKRDLFAYCVLYIKGGIYLDIRLKALYAFREWLPKDQDFIGVLQPPNRHGQIWNGFLACKPNNVFLKRAIDNIVENVNSRNYGLVYTDNLLRGAQSITGPLLLAKSVNQILNNPEPNQFSLGFQNHDKYHICYLRLSNNTHVKHYMDHRLVLSYNNQIDEQLLELGGDNYLINYQLKTVYHNVPKQLAGILEYNYELIPIYQKILHKFNKYTSLTSPSIVIKFALAPVTAN